MGEAMERLDRPGRAGDTPVVHTATATIKEANKTLEAVIIPVFSRLHAGSLNQQPKFDSTVEFWTRNHPQNSNSEKWLR